MATEKRLIDANALMDEVLNHPKPYRRDFYRMLNDAPTVDAVEVVHGRWKKHTVGGEDFFGSPVLITWACNCSVCGLDGREETPYCPNCGAKMDMEVYE